ncbi:MAG: thiolase family protein, partial [Desulfobacteraceae bacterium]|nr:thiolase family protein [Desulfobacteraceae bacterium]
MAIASVVGVGMISFGKHPDRTLVDLGSEAAYLVLKDAGLSPKQVQIGFFANGFAGRLFGDFTIGQNVFWNVGINRIPVVNVENACTSGSTALYLAYNAVAAGQVEVAMVVGAEKMYVPELGLLNSGQT